MSTDYSENSEQEGSIHPDSEKDISDHSRSGNSISLSLKTADVFSAFRFQDLLKLILQYWYIVLVGVVSTGTLLFCFNLDPPPFSGDTELRIRAVRGKNQVSEQVSIKGEAEDLRSPKLIRSVLRSLERPTVVVPVSGLKEKLDYYMEKRKQSGLISAMLPDKYNFDLKHFTVEDEEGTFYVSSLGNGKYALYDSDKDEILQSRFGVLTEDTGIKIQVDSIAGPEGLLYELRYLTEDEMVSWAVDNISTWREGKDGLGGSIKLTFTSYDKVLLVRFLEELGKIHVSNTEKRLRKGTVEALKEKKDKQLFLEQDLFKQERELEKLQRKSAQKGNLATSARELKQQVSLAEKTVQELNIQRDEAVDKYEDLRSIFSAEHPILINAREDLDKIDQNIAKIQGSAEGIPELLMEIQTIEESIQSLGKEKQLIDEEIANIEEIQRASRSYISVSQEPLLRGNNFIAVPVRMAVLGVLSGFVASVLVVVVANLRFVKTFTLDGEQSAFSDGHSVSEELDGSARSSSQFLSSEGSRAEKEHRDIVDEYSGQEDDMIFQDYSSEIDSVSMYVSEASSPSELDAPDIQSVSLSVMDLESHSVMGGELDFLEQDLLLEDVHLIATGVWNSKTFTEKSFRQLEDLPYGIIEIVNNTEANLVNAIVIFARRLARKYPVLLIDMQTDESIFTEFHKTENRPGFWEVLSKKQSLKNAILQTSHRYFILPSGIYEEQGIRMSRIKKLITAVQKKFTHIIVLHSQDISIWRQVRSQITQDSILFWLQADYSLYRMGRVQLPTSSSQDPHQILQSLFAKKRTINIQNNSQISVLGLLQKMLSAGMLKQVLLMETFQKRETGFPSIAAKRNLAAVLDESCSIKEAIHEVEKNLFVIPTSKFSGKEKIMKVNKIISMLEKKYAHVIVLRETSDYPHSANHQHLVIDEKGEFRLRTEEVEKL